MAVETCGACPSHRWLSGQLPVGCGSCYLVSGTTFQAQAVGARIGGRSGGPECTPGCVDLVGVRRGGGEAWLGLVLRHMRPPATTRPEIRQYRGELGFGARLFAHFDFGEQLTGTWLSHGVRLFFPLNPNISTPSARCRRAPSIPDERPASSAIVAGARGWRWLSRMQMATVRDSLSVHSTRQCSGQLWTASSSTAPPS